MKLKTLINYINNTDKKYSDIMAKAKASDNLKITKKGLDYTIKEGNKFIVLCFEDKDIDNGLTCSFK